MNICFRVDSSTKIGTGHVVRCLTLADELSKNGHNITFICRRLTGHSVHLINNKCYASHLLHYREDQENFQWKIDADETITILTETLAPIDWLIIDHYEISKEWEASLLPYVKKIMVIDDLANREHVCDMIVDQTFGETGERYQGLLPSSCIGLFGLDFAILRPQFREHRKNSFHINNNLITIHVFFGGNDYKGHTGKFSNLILKHFPKLFVKAVIGENYLNIDSIHELSKKYGNRFQWKQNIENMAEYMAECDLAIGAAGSTTWERACVGLPAAYLSINSNQIKILETLEKRGFCRYFGDADTLEENQFIIQTQRFISDKNLTNAMYQKCIQSVDGFGTKRIFESLIS
ncbi:UDP-2,4-diacetamido-2,4,6-trideoxy-beta-L-altropyranose hydrolase [Bacillus sp. S3]|uniref:UDP-2,4-diacetamido-2,4, 6-trideoxy-beta-L-altropyranose hydrolase n=1 Tax=Bacillus sp. S3 TaxID=486398 RepID=UPI00118CD77C|nr:UDP-2,4-diacetamido-2,4,6-trideoxy-beta-L-altropyranose hydrolase [Bacillus sp. S3]QCJ40991.1 UDP-2,4-diacetamido-2,4,6-trideoxy-beta-L-altropyranose hydrolase [Bacillus sp. S3]